MRGLAIACCLLALASVDAKKRRRARPPSSDKPAAQGLIKDWSSCDLLPDEAHYEEFVVHHNPRLHKAIFFSKLGKSTLCSKLAAAFAGRLDFAVVGKDNAAVAARLLAEELPALRVVRAGELEGHGLHYPGDFKFGAFDAISVWLEDSVL